MGWRIRFPAHIRRSVDHIMLSSIAGLAACSGTMDPNGCAQYVTFGGPIVVITGVTNAQTGAAITQFTLSNFTSNGQAVAASTLVAGIPGTNATIVNGTVQCTTSCGFGNTPVTYTFTVSAPGRPDKTVTVVGAYATHVKAQCTNEFRDGTATTISL